MLEVKSLATIFDEWFDGGHPPSDFREGEVKEIIERYGFNLRVVVPTDIPARHSTFSWIRGMGVTKFDEIFSGTLSYLPDEWLLAFPERHCSIVEQCGLILQMTKLNEKTGNRMKQLDIITSSPHIISDCMKEAISLISFPDGKITYDQDYMSM
jgi:hypothetical protein